jgi:hypothetical protein
VWIWRGDNGTLPSEIPTCSEQREKLRREVGTGKIRVEKLLEDQKMIKHALEYIKTTGRLEK